MAGSNPEPGAHFVVCSDTQYRNSPLGKSGMHSILQTACWRYGLILVAGHAKRTLVAGLADHPTLQKTAELIDVASGYTDNGIVHQGRLDPGVLLSSKPYRKSHLAKMIRQALG